MNNKCICILTTELSNSTYKIGKQIKLKLNLDVFFIIDSCKAPTFVNKKDLNMLILIKDEECIKNGFINCMITNGSSGTWIRKNPMAYDKLLYFNIVQNKNYDFIFSLEDDVFISNIANISKFINKYETYDLITANNFYKSDTTWDWHWLNVIDKIEAPYYYSMVCAFAFSRNLLNVIEKYVLLNKSLFYIECMFNTLAVQNNLKVIDAFELKSIVWLGKWDIDEFLLLPNNFFHPMKNINDHELLREKIKFLKKSKYKPKNKLPSFINDIYKNLV